MRQKWHIRVQQGYRVKITFLGFELEGCCDYVYLTWDVCDYNGAYSVRLGGSSLATTVYYSPPRVNNVNVYFYTDHSVTRPSVLINIFLQTYPAFALIGPAPTLLCSHSLRVSKCCYASTQHSSCHK